MIWLSRTLSWIRVVDLWNLFSRSTRNILRPLCMSWNMPLVNFQSIMCNSVVWRWGWTRTFARLHEHTFTFHAFTTWKRFRAKGVRPSKRRNLFQWRASRRDPSAKLTHSMSKIACTTPAWFISHVVFAHGCFVVEMAVNISHGSWVYPQRLWLQELEVCSRIFWQDSMSLVERMSKW